MVGMIFPARAELRSVEPTGESVAVDALEHEIRLHRLDVPEFKEIAGMAEARGLRVFLFGGSAAGLAHFARWSLLRSREPGAFPAERFRYETSAIYQPDQDFDLVVTRRDGSAESESDILELEKDIQRRFPDFLPLRRRADETAERPKGRWEVRGLRTQVKDKIPLADNTELLKQHTDSQSLGLIELTEPPKGDPLISDLVMKRGEKPRFLVDAAAARDVFRFSAAHKLTLRAQSGDNPEILAAIRYLTKVFQYDLEIDPKSLDYVKAIIGRFEPDEKMTRYAHEWIETQGKKLLLNAANVERAWNLLEELGLRRKLIAIRNDANRPGSLAWWLAKEPLRSAPSSAGHKIEWAGKPTGKTAGQLGIREVTHETSDYRAYLSIMSSPTGRPNFFVSRERVPDEAALQGEGFYVREGKKGGRGTGFHVRLLVDPSAVEGVDFKRGEKPGDIIFASSAKLKVVYDLEPLDSDAALKFLLDPANRDEKGLKYNLLERQSRSRGWEAFKERFREEAMRRIKSGGLAEAEAVYSLPVALEIPSLRELLEKLVANRKVPAEVMVDIFYEALQDRRMPLLQVFFDHAHGETWDFLMHDMLDRLNPNGSALNRSLLEDALDSPNAVTRTAAARMLAEHRLYSDAVIRNLIEAGLSNDPWRHRIGKFEIANGLDEGKIKKEWLESYFERHPMSEEALKLISRFVPYRDELKEWKRKAPKKEKEPASKKVYVVNSELEGNAPISTERFFELLAENKLMEGDTVPYRALVERINADPGTPIDYARIAKLVETEILKGDPGQMLLKTWFYFEESRKFPEVADALWKLGNGMLVNFAIQSPYWMVDHAFLLRLLTHPSRLAATLAASQFAISCRKQPYQGPLTPILEEFGEQPKERAQIRRALLVGLKASVTGKEPELAEILERAASDGDESVRKAAADLARLVPAGTCSPETWARLGGK